MAHNALTCNVEYGNHQPHVAKVKLKIFKIQFFGHNSIFQCARATCG